MLGVQVRLPLTAMRWLALITALLSSTALAQEISNSEVFAHVHSIGVGLGGKVVFRAPGTSYGKTTWAGLGTPTCELTNAGWNGSSWSQCGLTGTQVGGTITGNQLTPYRTAGFSADPINAVDFDGAGYVDFGDQLDASTDVTACTLFRVDDSTATGRILSKAGSYTLGVYSNAAYLYVYKNGGASSNTTGAAVASGAWHAFCGSYHYVADGTSATRAAINGVAKADTSNAVGPIPNTTAHTLLGAETVTPTNVFNGQVADVAIWTGTSFTSGQLAAATAAMIAETEDPNFTLAYARTGAAWASNNGTRFGYGPTAIPVTENGFSMDNAVVSQLLQNNCATLVDTQTPTTTAVAHYVKMTGTGRVDISAGTATCATLPASATAAAPLSYTCAVGGTLSVAFTGSVTSAQLEKAGEEHRDCCCLSAACSCQQGALTVPNPLATKSAAPFCVSAYVTARTLWKDNIILEVGDYAGSAANSARLSAGGTEKKPMLGLKDAAAGTRTWTATSAVSSLTSGSSHTLVACWGNDNTASLHVDGADVPLIASGSGTGILSAFGQTLYLGSNSGGTYQWTGWMRDIAVCHKLSWDRCTP